MKCKKTTNKFICVFCSFLILVFGLLQSSTFCIRSYASSSSSMTVDDYLKSTSFYDVCCQAYRKIGAIPDAFGGGVSVTYQAFLDYLVEKDKTDILDMPVEIVDLTSSGGGRGYDIPQEARQEIINYVTEVYVEEQPLGYTTAYVKSYNYMSASQFTSIALYEALQDFIRSQDGYTFIVGNMSYGSFDQNGWIYVIPRSVDHGFYGTVISGLFSSVQNVVNWQGGNAWDHSSSVKRYSFTSDGNITEWTSGYWYGSPYVMNGTSIPTNGQNTGYNVFTNSQYNEAVYVFDNVNAYKNYNAGSPQAYYMLGDPNYVAPYSDVWTPSDLDLAGTFYNSIVNNVGTGDTPQQIQDTTRDVLNGVTSGGESSDSGFDLGFLGTISKVIKAVTGAFVPVQDLITENISEFISDVFGWLPQEIVILWVAGIIFAVLFGILKLIRG